MSARPVGDLALNECPRCKGDMAVVSSGKLPPKLARVEGLVAKEFEVLDFELTEERMKFEVFSPDTKVSFGRLFRSLEPEGYFPILRKQEEELVLFVGKRPKLKKARPWVNLLLLGATVASTFFAGYFWAKSLVFAYLFSGSILLVLGAHELGHKIAAWKHGVVASPPYFIPGHPLIGTFGALIKIKSPIPTKEALVELGASGPILGFLVALPITLVGLICTRPQVEIPVPFTPLAFGLVQLLVKGAVHTPLRFHPLAFAGWVGMFITMLNLMPAGQLDGGHVARGILNRERHHTLGRLLGISLVATGFFAIDLPLWLWGMFILVFFGRYHAGALDDVSELSKRQKLLAAVVFGVFLLLVPVPPGWVS